MEKTEVYRLPLPHQWTQPEDVAVYVRECLSAVGLEEWSFAWDRAVRRLGCCSYARRRITLSRYYVEAYLTRDVGMLRRTVLHELAHALAMVHHRAGGHGSIWQHYCALLGIAGERATCRCDDFTPPHFRTRQTCYVLCHKVTGEIFYRYRGKPRMSKRRLATSYITGRRGETLGQLVIRQLADGE